MNIFSIIFLIIGFGSMIGAFILEGGSPIMLASASDYSSISCNWSIFSIGNR